MRQIIKLAILTPALLWAASAQTPDKAEFEVASIKTNASQSGFHFAADDVSGGPGTSDPAIFRCSRCSLATLFLKAFNLQPYQFPDRKSFTGATYDVLAKIPTGTTGEQFSAMLQNLLKDRFGLAWHFQEKKLKGYHLVIAKDGPKLTPSTGAPLAPAANPHASGPAESHNHSGAMVFGTSAFYRAANATPADLARVLSDQIGLPVEDQTGLPDRYNISLRWSSTSSANGNHAEGFSGGPGHAGHESGGAGPSAPAGDASGPTLFDAIQQQLGLKLAPADLALAHLLVVDHVAQRPTEN